MRKILVLRGGALGDFIVTLPMLLALREKWPGATIELAGNAVAAEIARSRGLLNQVHSQHERRWSTLFAESAPPDEFRRWLATFDLVVNFWPDPDRSLQRLFPLRGGQHCVTAAALPARAPAAAHYVGALAALGVVAAGDYCRIDGGSIVFGGSRSAGASRPADAPVAIHPGSGSPRKNWPIQRWLELMAATAGPVRLIIGEAEDPNWGELHRTGFRDTALAGRFARGELQAIVRPALERIVDHFSTCRLYLGHDSGVSHLAAACGLPSVLLFGPTDPAVWAPPAPYVRVVRRGATLAAITTTDVVQAVCPPLRQ